MASATSYFSANYDNEASGPFVALSTTLLTWSGGSGFIVWLVDEGTTGKLGVALLSGAVPNDNDVLTQGTTTADTNEPILGSAPLLLYPAYFRNDVSLAASGALTWTGPALGATHSFLFDGQTSNVVTGEILTFSPGGQQCEVITIVSDAGTSGELDVRWISAIDSVGYPDDNDTFSGDISGDGTLNGLVYERCYSALHLHRLLADLNDDSIHAGDDVWSMYKPTASQKQTDAIINLLGNINITDTISQHMYAGSISQASGDTLYSGLNIQITDRDNLTEPVVVQNDAIVTAYWANAFMPHSVQGKVRILLKTREDGVDIDGKRVRGKLLRYGDSYFEGATTLGTATTALALFSTLDGNNGTAEGTVAGAPYNTIVLTEGFQQIDYGDGSGNHDFGLSIDIGSATRAQMYERTKYIQREDSAETLFGRNARLFGGITLNFAYDAEVGGPFSENEIVAWGQNELPYTGETGGPFTVGNVLVGGTSGARGRIIYLDDQGTAGTMLVELEGTTAFSNTETITEYSGGTATGASATTGTVVSGNATFGTGVLVALDDQGTTGNLYLQLIKGLSPSDNQKIYGATSLATCLVNGSVSTRVVNNQFVGVYTGTNFQTNFGIAVDATDAIANDQFPDLDGGTASPPNNQTGLVTGVQADMYVTCYPWDGTTTDAVGDPEPDFNEMTLSAGVTGGSSTTVVVGAGNIPDNTPASGTIRLQRDSDSEYDLLSYSSWENTTGTFTLVGTAPNTASIGNNVFRALIDQTAGATSVSYVAILGTSNQVAITARRGGTTTPIVPAKATATFGANGFTVNLQPQSDV